MKRTVFLSLIVTLSLIFSFSIASCMDLFDDSEIQTSFTVTFKANYDGNTEKDVVQVYGYNENKPLEENIFSRGEGYRFVGWTRDETSSVAEYADKALLSFSSDIVLYAVWNEIKGESSGITVDWVNEEPGKLITYQIEENKITFYGKEGYKTYTWSDKESKEPLSGDNIKDNYYIWDTSAVAAGNYQITLIVEDEDGKPDEETVYIVLKK